ncbi:MAG TPA: hypothetical protein VGP72_03970 [Planctomycetota bacterium]|jgi:hypothetical protein
MIEQKDGREAVLFLARQLRLMKEGHWFFIGVPSMPEGKHLRGVSKKERRQYEHIKASAQKKGRYGKRAKEVAARTVMKQHKQKGHTAGK